jgi:hypothetical protein
MKDIQVTISFDMRTPAQKLYRAAMEMAAFADKIGVDTIGLYRRLSQRADWLRAQSLLCSQRGNVGRFDFLAH